MGIVHADDGCQGKFINPINDVCWSCLFPMTIGSKEVVKGNLLDLKNPKLPVCICRKPHFRIGLSFGFWEPTRLVDVTRHPYCMVSLGGKNMEIAKNKGTGFVSTSSESNNTSFYHVHWYISPILYWFNLLTDAACIEIAEFDVGYFTELDPAWNDEALAFLLYPEAKLFANKESQLACGVDCAAANTKLPLDSLYWCAGCQGSMFPLTGFVQAHIGGVQASTLLAERLAFKLHREGLLPGTSGKKAMCKPYKMPTMKKSQYRYQMTFPIAATKHPKGCKPFGSSTLGWEARREFPIQGEDFAYLLWRKRNCCAL